MIVLDTSAMVELLVGSDATAEEIRALVIGQKLQHRTPSTSNARPASAGW